MLNTCMNKQEQQYQIRVSALRDTEATDAWLKQKGLNVQLFAKLETLHLNAQRAAKRTLAMHREHMQLELLDSKQQGKLEQYLQYVQLKSKRERLTDAKAYQVLNICTRANKRLFKQHRQNKH